MDKGEVSAATGMWRYLVLWGVMLLGMSLGFCVSGRHGLLADIHFLALLPPACISLLVFSVLSIWGLPLVMPLLCVCHGWLHSLGRWWQLLPVGVLLVALLTAVSIPLLDLDALLLQATSAYRELPLSPAEDLTASMGAVEAWRLCGEACGALILLLVLHIQVCCGMPRACMWICSYGGLFLNSLAQLRRAGIEQARGDYGQCEHKDYENHRDEADTCRNE